MAKRKLNSKKKRSETPLPSKEQLLLGPMLTDHIAVKIKPTNEFWNWLSDHSTKDEMEHLKAEGGTSVILLPDFGEADLQFEYLQSRFSYLKIALFGPWITNSDLWPKLNELTDINNYFHLDFIPDVLELEPTFV